MQKFLGSVKDFGSSAACPGIILILLVIEANTFLQKNHVKT